MKWLKYILLALPLLVACGDTGRDASAGAQGERVRVDDFEYNLLPEGQRVVTGKLYNATSAPIERAQIQVSLFDADNQRISSMIIDVRDVPPNGHKAFREVVEGEGVQGARVRSVLIL